ncbi:MAG: hypothetical protein ACI9MR_000225 [Myxococcota bacterium]|jgi:hypothetical protein
MSDVQFAAYAIIAAFSTYFCMYAFRKPFTAGKFEGTQVDLGFLPPVDYKILLIVAQICGYMLSKFIGIKVVTEMSGKRRGLAIIVLILIAEVALGLFAITPKPYNTIFLFINGLPLGMVWGLVFGYLEGRRVSEILGAGLSASYIVASGVVKTIGRVVVDDMGVSEEAMPFVVGLFFFPAMLGFVWMLTKLPKPSADDEAVRTRRAPMDKTQRRAFLKSYWPGLLALTFLYFFLTAYRSFRDDFAVEIWGQLGYGDTPSILSTTELIIAFGILVALGLLYLVKDNRKALKYVHALMAFGTALVGVATLLFQAGSIGPVVWMIGVGLGLYLAYVPFGCVLFDRMIAAVGFVATAVFMIYVTDAVGYLGYVIVVFFKNFGAPELSWLEFFTAFSYLTSVLCTVCFLVSMVYFMRKTRKASIGNSDLSPS